MQLFEGVLVYLKSVCYILQVFFDEMGELFGFMYCNVGVVFIVSFRGQYVGIGKQGFICFFILMVSIGQFGDLFIGFFSVKEGFGFSLFFGVDCKIVYVDLLE